MFPDTGPRRGFAADRIDGGSACIVDGVEPFDAEIFERFLRGELGWEAFVPMSGGMYLEEGGLYDGLLFVRCAPGRTNPLSSVYPEMPRGIRGCAPTIDDFRYETARIRLGQPARTDPSGIWVVSA